MNGINLIVIDVYSKSEGIVSTLMQAGYRVQICRGLESAIRVLSLNQCDLIICSSAVKNSPEVGICSKLRETAEHILPICLIGEEKERNKQINLLMETGADEYIPMPFNSFQFIRQITDLIHSHQKQKKNLFRSLIENTTDIITVIKLDGTILYESPSVKQILGRKPTDSLGTNAFELIHPDDRKKIVEYIKVANRKETAEGVEYRVRHRNDSWRVFHSVGKFNEDIFNLQTVVINSRDITEKKLVEERHQAVLNKARIVWWEWEVSTDKIKTSENFSEIYGISKIENSQMGFDILHPDDAEKHKKIVEKIAESGGSYHSEFRIIRKSDGKIVWIEETASAIVGKGGKVERLVGIAMDITLHKAAEKALVESETKFKKQFMGIPTPTYIWKKISGEGDFILIDSNYAGDQLTTSFSSRFFGGRASDLLINEPPMLEALHRSFNESKLVQIETEYHHKTTNALKILDLSYVHIPPDLVMVHSRDITHRKQIERERAELISKIQSQRQRLNDVIATVPGVVWESELLSDEITEQKITFISNYVEKMTGYKAEDFFADSLFWSSIIHPDDRAKTFTASEEFIKNAGEGFLEYRFIGKDKRIIWTETHLTGIRDENGKITRISGITLDITKRKEAEEALLRSEEQLRQSQRLESVGKLAGGIAHDFNNMLTAINGYSDLILREIDETSSIYRKANEIKKAGTRSALLTQQLLAFSRRQILKPQLIDVNQVVSEMGDLLRRLIGEDIQLKINLNQTECRVEADPGQLTQVIVNLVVNARDAMPEGGELEVETANVYLDEEYARNHLPTVPGNYVRLMVSDTGIGVDESIRDYIFEPFYTTKSKGSGTGLGLSTVYGIVKQSGGYIWLESGINKGSTFIIYLPQIRDEIKLEKLKYESEIKISGNETILLVEDENSVRELAVQILQTYGYKVIAAKDGIEALKICKESAGEISILITDVVMPRMNGRELVARVAELNPNIRILFTSGYTDDKYLRNDATGKKIEFIQKPFTPEELGKKVRNILDR